MRNGYKNHKMHRNPCGILPPSAAAGGRGGVQNPPAPAKKFDLFQGVVPEDSRYVGYGVAQKGLHRILLFLSRLVCV